MNAADRNRALAVRWFEEVWNERRDETIDDLIAEGGVAHLEGMPPAGKEELKAARSSILDAVSDLRVTVEDTLAYGNDVVVRWRLRGTHDGPGLGLPASGKEVDARGMTWLRFEDGQIVEGWDAWNQGAFVASLAPVEAVGGREAAEGQSEAAESDPQTGEPTIEIDLG